MKFGIVVFPGSNCDADVYHAVTRVFKKQAVYLWHKDTNLQNCDVIILPGGFSYGDYLRCGAIARFSPIMNEVVSFAKKGGKVLGICNGFQILTEAGLLPGALIRNKNLHFICDTFSIKVVNNQTPFTKSVAKNHLCNLPIAHAEGRYFIDENGLKKLQDQNQIVFQYEGENPNGSLFNIAGISNETGNVVGLMPHPERVCEKILGRDDGKFIFESLIQS